jgi:hypothetical protein
LGFGREAKRRATSSSLFPSFPSLSFSLLGLGRGQHRPSLLYPGPTLAAPLPLFWPRGYRPLLSTQTLALPSPRTPARDMMARSLARRAISLDCTHASSTPSLADATRRTSPRAQLVTPSLARPLAVATAHSSTRPLSAYKTPPRATHLPSAPLSLMPLGYPTPCMAARAAA